MRRLKAIFLILRHFVILCAGFLRLNGSLHELRTDADTRYRSKSVLKKAEAADKLRKNKKIAILAPTLNLTQTLRLTGLTVDLT